MEVLMSFIIGFLFARAINSINDWSKCPNCSQVARNAAQAQINQVQRLVQSEYYKNKMKKYNKKPKHVKEEV